MPLCDLCPRECHTDRRKAPGYCLQGAGLRAALAGLHFGEEPCLTGGGAAGAVFFSGCNLGCVYCQNREISRENKGKPLTVSRLTEIFDELIDAGAECIDLVTPTQFTDLIRAALEKKKPDVPVVWNSGGYESVKTLRTLEGLVDVYLPDYKYAGKALASRLSFAPDYPAVALDAIREMVRQTGNYRLDEDGILKKGVLVRHLVLPGFIENSLDCLDTLTGAFSEDEILLSVMSQYTPPAKPLGIDCLNRRLTEEEYGRVLDYIYLLGLDNVWVQELSSADAFYTPDFDLSGV